MNQGGEKPPVYHRQRMLLYFLECAPNGLTKIDLQKLMFLYSKDTQSKHYDFAPYRYGAYSFQSASDLDLLIKRNWIQKDCKNIFLNQDIEGEQWATNNEERLNIHKWMETQLLRGDELVRHTYQLYPYYARHSEIKEELLNAEELNQVANSINPVKNREITVFTIGYEGIHFETYLNKLIRNHVAALCDVRRNPLSRKFGFSAQKLKDTLTDIDIEYIPFPELGIDSLKRRGLTTQENYNTLFNAYRKELSNKITEMDRLKQIIESKRRVALTCFEALPQSCHRHCISDFLENNCHYQVEHL